MATPLEDLSDDELNRALAEGQLGERKAAIAEEILRRRKQERREQLLQKYNWLALVFSAVALLASGVRRFWRSTN